MISVHEPRAVRAAGHSLGRLREAFLLSYGVVPLTDQRQAFRVVPAATFFPEGDLPSNPDISGSGKPSMFRRKVFVLARWCAFFNAIFGWRYYQTS